MDLMTYETYACETKALGAPMPQPPVHQYE